MADSPILHACLSGVTTLLKRSINTGPIDDDAAVAQLLTGVQLSLLDEADRQEMQAGVSCAAGRREQIEAYITSHLGDPDLSPAALADAFGISVRSVHAAFADAPATVGTFIRQQRIAELRQAVENASDPIPVEDLAVMFGFRDTAKLRRVFRDTTGEPFRGWLNRRAPSTSERHCSN